MFELGETKTLTELRDAAQLKVALPAGHRSLGGGHGAGRGGPRARPPPLLAARARAHGNSGKIAWRNSAAAAIEQPPTDSKAVWRADLTDALVIPVSRRRRHHHR